MPVLDRLVRKGKLARRKAGFRLALRDDMGDKVIKQPLHACAGGAGHPEQRSLFAFNAVS